LLGFHNGDYIAPSEPAYRQVVIAHITQTSCAANVDKTLPSHKDCLSKHIVSITKLQQRLMYRQQIVYCRKQAMFSHKHIIILQDMGWPGYILQFQNLKMKAAVCNIHENF
jgi:hypothetical protein